MVSVRCEVAIIGGGPAGAIAARVLGNLGRDVILCEAIAFPRDHVGICMGAGAAKILTTIGLGGLLRNPAHRETRSMERAWESEVFEETAREDLICDRGILDRDLLAAAVSAGVRLMQPVRIGARQRTSEGWRLRAQGPSGELEIEARFLIEAGGRRAAPRRRRLAPATVALFGTWTGDAGSVRLAATAESWIWAAPTARGDTSAIAVLDPSDPRLSEWSIGQLHATIARQAGVLRAGQQPIGSVHAIDATPFESFSADNSCLRIGEAALGLDPLSSSGLSAAIQSALAAGAAVQTFLDGDGDDGAALDYLATSHARRRTQHTLHMARAYAAAAKRHPGAFWIARAGDALTSDGGPSSRPHAPLPQTSAWLARAPSVRIAPAACVTGDRIERIRAVATGAASEPIAFVDGVAIAPLLDRVPAGIRANELLLNWAATIGPGTALAILSWAWRNEVLVAAAPDRGLDADQPLLTCVD